ncbi:hypothetical protein MVES1_003198 [Malassezia vespertilionis]|uniref:Early meiotic induction protein 1 n=1 Tax=Malassezia vespertilionis TaxID=2020962 RepID=A0A2N1J9U2_9BASI|nr:uncharacterized protein MVES1_003198 [Malassezia vespertilionis]PKI83323.1 hypothetical protein MVES_003038 [Malassezia vespertilionis]WFD07827.1 hypothetical protein MVES1_003198 [Malassezia vespertilionis]
MGAAASKPGGAAATQGFEQLHKEELALDAAATSQKEVPSCLTLFDRWLSCYALGVQFRNVYRYGTIADCAPRREDFKFCLTMRELDPEMRRAAWLNRRAEEKAHQRQSVHSSENVWEMRRDPLLSKEYEDDAFPAP